MAPARFQLSPSLATPQTLQFAGLVLMIVLLLALWFKAPLKRATGALAEFIASTLPFGDDATGEGAGRGTSSVPVLVLVNPKSGGGLGSTIAAVLEQIEGIEVFHLSTLGLNDCVRRLRQLKKKQPRLVCAGGDGTVTAVVRTLLAAGLSSIPVAVLPLGTGNDCARSLGMKALPSAASLRAMKAWVHKVTRAPVVSTDVFEVAFDTFDGGGIVCVRNGEETQLSETVVRGTALCYCSVGTDARITFTVELHRKKSRLLNMLTYFLAGAINNFAFRTPVTDNVEAVLLNPVESEGGEEDGAGATNAALIQGQTTVIDPRYIPRLHSFLCLLIPSYAAGTNAWRYAWTLSKAVYRSYFYSRRPPIHSQPGNSLGVDEAKAQGHAQSQSDGILADWHEGRLLMNLEKDAANGPVPHELLAPERTARLSSSSSSSSVAASTAARDMGMGGEGSSSDVCCATARARVSGLLASTNLMPHRKTNAGSSINTAEPTGACCCRCCASVFQRQSDSSGGGTATGCPLPPAATNPYRDLEAGASNHSAPPAESAANGGSGGLHSSRSSAFSSSANDLAAIAGGYSAPHSPTAQDQKSNGQEDNDEGNGFQPPTAGGVSPLALFPPLPPRSRPWYLRFWGCVRRQGRRFCSSPLSVPYWRPQRRDDGTLEFVGIRSILQMGAVIGLQSPLLGGLYRLAQPSAVTILFKRPYLVSDFAAAATTTATTLTTTTKAAVSATTTGTVASPPSVPADVEGSKPVSLPVPAPPAIPASPSSSLLRRAAAAVGRGAVSTVGATARVVRRAAGSTVSGPSGDADSAGGVVIRKKHRQKSAVQAPPELVELVPPPSHLASRATSSSASSNHLSQRWTIAEDGGAADASFDSSDDEVEQEDGEEGDIPDTSLQLSLLAQPSPTRKRAGKGDVIGVGDEEGSEEGPLSATASVLERGFAIAPRGGIVIDHCDVVQLPSSAVASAAAVTTVRLSLSASPSTKRRRSVSATGSDNGVSRVAPPASLLPVAAGPAITTAAATTTAKVSPTTAVTAANQGIRQRLSAAASASSSSSSPPSAVPAIEVDEETASAAPSALSEPSSSSPLRPEGAGGASASEAPAASTANDASSAAAGAPSSMMAIQGRAFSETEPIYIQIDGESFKVFGLRSLKLKFKAKARMVTFGLAPSS